MARLSKIRSNPVLRNIDIEDTGVKSVSFAGISIKTGLLLVLAIVSGVIALSLGWSTNPIILFGSGIVGFIAVMVGSFSPNLAKFASVIYAICQGFFVIALTAVVEEIVPGAAVIAVLATVCIFTVIFVLYQTKLVQMTSGFVKFMVAVGAGIFLLTIVVMISSIFTDTLRDMFFGNSILSLVIALVMLAWGAFTLIFDFERAKYLVHQGADKKYEWVVSLGLLVSIIYIYVQVLRIILIIASRVND